jgi:Tfp pilus assembly protein FimV
MVAIHIPRPADEWVPAPQVTPDVVPDRTPLRERPRRLPDRATRVRRRRLVVLVAGVVVAFALAGAAQLLSGLASVDESPRPEPISGGEYVVQPGDTLWSIAARLAPDDDPRAVVDALRAANGGADLQVGDRLDLDVG